MSRTTKFVLLANLAVVTVLVFLFPHLMVAPGELIDGHREMATDCFACHAPMFGASSAKCATCHKVEEIGLLTTKGVAVTGKDGKQSRVRFHQKLVGQDCVACHGDHRGVTDFRSNIVFTHTLLEEPVRKQCTACHQPIIDAVHRQTATDCGACHSTDRWKPATLDHTEYFVFDRDHRTECATCHNGPDYKTFTCYGCHEHTVAKLEEEHLEEGVRDWKDCAACHRSGDEHQAERAWRSIQQGIPFDFKADRLDGGDRRKRKRRHRDDD